MTKQRGKELDLLSEDMAKVLAHSMQVEFAMRNINPERDAPLWQSRLSAVGLTDENAEREYKRFAARWEQPRNPSLHALCCWLKNNLERPSEAKAPGSASRRTPEEIAHNKKAWRSFREQVLQSMGRGSHHAAEQEIDGVADEHDVPQGEIPF